MENNDRKIIYDAKKEKGLSQEALVVLLKKWQIKLKMEDWNLDLKIVAFCRKDYRQSGDFIAAPERKEATILMTNDPWRGDEEYTLVHEMIHVLFYDYDKYNEDLILKNYREDSDDHNKYMEKLEDLVHKFTRVILGRSDR